MVTLFLTVAARNTGRGHSAMVSFQKDFDTSQEAHRAEHQIRKGYNQTDYDVVSFIIDVEQDQVTGE